MAIVAPVWANFATGQAGSLVLTVAGDLSAHTLAYTVRGYAGGTALVSKATGGSGVTASHSGGTTTITVSLTSANLTLAPGLYEHTLYSSTGECPVFDPSGFLVTASGSAAYPRLCNLSTYLAHLGASQTIYASDETGAAQALWCLAAAESAFKRATNRQLTYASRTAYLPATWSDKLLLTETPVESIVSIYHDPVAAGGQGSDDFPSTTLLTAGDDYYLDRDRPGDNYSNSGIVYRVGNVWYGRYRRGFDQLHIHREASPRAIKATWTGGYGNAIRPPEDLLTGIFEAATLIRKAAPEGGRMWQSQSGESHSVSLGPLEAEVRRLASTHWGLGHYRRIVI